MVADYSNLLYLYQIDENTALEIHMRYLMFLILDSIMHINIVKMQCQTGHIRNLSSTPGLVLRRLTHENHEFKCSSKELVASDPG